MVDHQAQRFSEKNNAPSMCQSEAPVVPQSTAPGQPMLGITPSVTVEVSIISLQIPGSNVIAEEVSVGNMWVTHVNIHQMP